MSIYVDVPNLKQINQTLQVFPVQVLIIHMDYCSILLTNICLPLQCKYYVDYGTHRMYLMIIHLQNIQYIFIAYLILKVLFQRTLCFQDLSFPKPLIPLSLLL